MIMDLRGKTALVTGGAVRIGEAICRALAAEGVHVAVHYRTSEHAARALCRDLEQEGVNAWALKADLSDGPACEALVRKAVQQAGRLDLLVNNAGVFHKNSLRESDEQNILAELRVNLVAPLLLMKAFAQAAGRGSIVNLLDRRITGLDTSCAPYVLSKKALAEATRLAALEFAPDIAVNAVAPGAILPPPGKGAGYLQDVAGPVPLQRACTVRDVAEAVVFLLKSEVLTGQIVFVDGGQHLL